MSIVPALHLNICASWSVNICHIYMIIRMKTTCHPNGTKLHWPTVECYHGAIIRLEAA